jgi:SanA protein
MRKAKKAKKRMIPIFLVIIVAILLLPRLFTVLTTQKQIFRLEEAPSAQAAIVFGAGLYRNGTPTPILRDRIDTAIDLYFQRKVKKIVMSGSSDGASYNEPLAMYEYAVNQGVPSGDIILDQEGHRTYDTCYRAKNVYELQDVLLVTQLFHLPRAIFSCDHLGLKSNGVIADRRKVFFENYIREIPATIVAIWEAVFSHPALVIGEKQPIFPPDDQSPQKGWKETKHHT